MKIIVWKCECCNRGCILPFDGKRYSVGHHGFIAPDFCMREPATCGTEPWKLRKVEESDIVKYFIDSNLKWKTNTSRGI